MGIFNSFVGLFPVNLLFCFYSLFEVELLWTGLEDGQWYYLRHYIFIALLDRTKNSTLSCMDGIFEGRYDYSLSLQEHVFHRKFNCLSHLANNLPLYL